MGTNHGGAIPKAQSFAPARCSPRGNAFSPLHDLEEQVKQLHMKLWQTSSPELSPLPPSV